PSIAADDPALPDLWAGVYDSALVFDRADERLWLTSWTREAGATAALSALARDAREAARSAAVMPATLKGHGSGVVPATPEESGSVDAPSALAAGQSANGDAVAGRDGHDPSRADAFGSSGRDGFLAG